MDMISLYNNTKRRWGREWGKGGKRGIPWAGQLLSPQWCHGLRKWCLVPQMFALSCWLKYLSWVLIRQAESKLSKGHCFLRGRVRRRKKNQRSQWHQMSPLKSHIPFTLTSSHMAIHSLPTFEIPRYYNWMLNDFLVIGKVPSTPLKNEFHKPLEKRKGTFLGKGIIWSK